MQTTKEMWQEAQDEINERYTAADWAAFVAEEAAMFAVMEADYQRELQEEKHEARLLR